MIQRDGSSIGRVGSWWWHPTELHRQRVLTPGPYQADGITWSPDSTTIAFSSARHDTWDLDWIIDLFTVPADGSELPVRVSDHTAQYLLPSWSQDGKRLAFLRMATPLDEPRHLRVGVIDVESGQTTELTSSLDRNCAPYGATRAPVWAGDNLLFSVETEGNAHVYSVDADGDGAPEPIVEGQRWVQGWDWASGTLAMAISTPTTFSEIVTLRERDSRRGRAPQIGSGVDRGAEAH